MQSIKLITITVVSFLINISYSQSAKDSELFRTLKANDSILFEISFNTCDLSVLDNLLAKDLEFYHDQGGITNSKEAFITVMKNGICKETNPYKSRRELIQNSLEVFPLFTNGELYGALQKGVHRFFETHKGKEKPGSIAKFSHLWLKENDQWILKRVISYDHKMPPTNTTRSFLVPNDILESYLGHYKAPKSGDVYITKIETGLMISAGNMKSPISAESKTMFKHAQAPLTFEFVLNKKSEVFKIIIREQGTIVEEAIKQ